MKLMNSLVLEFAALPLFVDVKFIDRINTANETTPSHAR